MGNVAAVNTFCKNSMWAQKGVFLIGGKKKKARIANMTVVVRKQRA